jgi:threonine synthase
MLMFVSMGIWDYSQIKNTLVAEQYISLGEGNTPIDKIEANGVEIYLKREEVNPSGSYKDRGTAYKLTQLVKDGVTHAVISSSGNAAISFMYYATTVGFKMTVIISPETNPQKLEIIQRLAEQGKHEVIIDVHARRKAAEISATQKIPNLRASTDAAMPIGYQSLGYELEAVSYSDIFVATSSGTALLGISQALNSVAFHACQTARIHPIAEEFDHDFTAETERSLADAITDKIALRKAQILPVLKNSNGSGWVLTNSEIKAAFELANKQLTKSISYTSAITIAGFIKAHAAGKVGHRVICIASGR